MRLGREEIQVERVINVFNNFLKRFFKIWKQIINYFSKFATATFNEVFVTVYLEYNFLMMDPYRGYPCYYTSICMAKGMRDN